jgi:1-phosphofructokinase family hexose kinase
MILTITLNPLLERRFYFNGLNGSKTNRASAIKMTAGGKGINVSRQLNKLGLDTVALTFLSGINGKNYRKILQDENIKFSPVQVKDEMREGAILIDKEKKSVTHNIGPNFAVSKEEADEFKSKMEKMIENCDVVVFSGSSLGPATDDIFAYGIEAANKLDKLSILDTYGAHLKACLEKEPSMLHINLSEAESSFNLKLTDEEKKLELLRDLHKKYNVRRVFLTDGKKPFYASNFDYMYKCEFPEIEEYDATGSGDAFTAGIAYGMEKSYSFEEILKFSSALGAVNASMEDVCEASFDSASGLMDSVIVTPIGKRIREINADIY